MGKQFNSDDVEERRRMVKNVLGTIVKGATAGEACETHGVKPAIYYYWKKTFRKENGTLPATAETEPQVFVYPNIRETEAPQQQKTAPTIIPPKAAPTISKRWLVAGDVDSVAAFCQKMEG